MSGDVFGLEPFEGRYAKNYKGKFGNKTFLVRHHPGKCLLPAFYSDISQKVLNASVRKSDVWMVSFPRTGSTWCQEIIWLVENNLDFETAKGLVQQLRAPLLEASMILFEYVDSTTATNDITTNQSSLKIKKSVSPCTLIPPQSEKETSNKIGRYLTDSVGFVESQPSPRCIKTHLPIEVLPEQLLTVNPRIIYTMRNPKDLCVSYYHYYKMAHNLNVDFEHFCELFLRGDLPFGSVFNHYFGFWNRRHEPNILIVRYEDMKTDTRGTVKKIASFLEKPLTDEDIDAVCEFSSFQNMRENKACNLQTFVDLRLGPDYYKKSGQHFIRKGIIGDHKNHMSQKMIERFDKWIEENTRNTDLTF